LYQAIKRKGHLDVEFVADKKEIVGRLAPELASGDVALTLGAGDIYRTGEELVEALQ
jgi:UDP-N-acetylmuramate--alanine ligase